MVVILYQSGCRKIAKKVAADLVEAFTDHVKVALIAAKSSSSWPADVSWDDLLIVMFDGKRFPDTGELFIKKYLAQRESSALIRPLEHRHRQQQRLRRFITTVLQKDRAAD